MLLILQTKSSECPVKYVRAGEVKAWSGCCDTQEREEEKTWSHATALPERQTLDAAAAMCTGWHMLLGLFRNTCLARRQVQCGAAPGQAAVPHPRQTIGLFLQCVCCVRPVEQLLPIRFTVSGWGRGHQAKTCVFVTLMAKKQQKYRVSFGSFYRV